MDDLWMPLPKLEEMLAMKVVLAPGMSNDELKMRIGFVGCIPLNMKRFGNHASTRHVAEEEEEKALRFTTRDILRGLEGESASCFYPNLLGILR